ncbi:MULTISPECIES: extracellular solute-binding protein [Nitratireductor]|uniref:extracellular solute-binding protein n=1 Tax=Nitratireductor TaxID=245876 RepID=UPI0026235DE0|nr:MULTISPECIES: extracellular solute-binding protein [Nitratireductor]MCV0352396.1 extracellular solute-binding protein [Nitratireductor sp.]MDV2967241.1 extracellular solute-binding protein [Nitratireductor aquimarinus]
MKALTAAIAATLMSTAAYAVTPIGSEEFNIQPGFELAELTSENFYDVIVPQAKEEGKLTFFDFTNSFGPLFTDRLLPAFEEEYGITVNYIRGNNEAAVQQLIAANNSGVAAPADVYFVGSSTTGLLMRENVMANVPLADLLPNADGFNQDIARVSGGVDHGGSYVPFHRNQTSIIYDTRTVSGDDVPTTADALLAWAEANPGKFVVTSPAGGGSGNGFMQSVAYAKVEGDDCRAEFSNFSMTEDEAKAYVEGACLNPVWDYYKKLIPVAEITNGNSDTLNLVANGAGAIGTAWEDMAYDFIGRGLLPPTVRQQIIESGQVGGGDGMFLPVGSEHPAAALLFLDFMSQHDIQLEKLGVNGSRSARTDIDPGKSFTEEQAARLIPTNEFAERALPSLPAPLRAAMRDYIVANLLRATN